ncbi:unnamed protein product [Colias eurytheme]|nr:unnamed protein product [Colias eurytheme]
MYWLRKLLLGLWARGWFAGKHLEVDACFVSTSLTSQLSMGSKFCSRRCKKLLCFEFGSLRGQTTGRTICSQQ